MLRLRLLTIRPRASRRSRSVYPGLLSSAYAYRGALGRGRRNLITTDSLPLLAEGVRSQSPGTILQSMSLWQAQRPWDSDVPETAWRS